ncbi:MAG: DUF3054 family protein [Chloroflexi bacterium]|nr:DUF3054 family protein [Chloroflexota bacterium]
MKNGSRLLFFGDLLTCAILTLIGFASHNEVGSNYLVRMFVNFVALAFAWLAAAWGLGLYDLARNADPRQLWRPLLAAGLAGSLAAVLRGLLLGADVKPVFALVLSATTALGMLVWRWWWGRLAMRS